MTWFIFSLIAFFAWSGSDIFSKLGTNQKDKGSEWKVVFFVGLIMGLHFLLTIICSFFISEPESLPKFVSSLIYTDFTIKDFLIYLPIALTYILAMVIGYIGLRYIELSLSSPICNASGSVALIICAILFSDIVFEIPTIIGVSLITIGIVVLGIVQYREDDLARELRQKKSNRKYTKSIIALLIPVGYLIIDALGTVGDQYLSYLSEMGKVDISDYASNSAFELTFLIIGIIALIIGKVKYKSKFFAKENKVLALGGICETFGQIFYMAVMFDTSDGAEVGMVIISAYCALSVLWSRIFLRERLSAWHYLTIGIVFLGIVLLGIFSPV